MTSVDGLTAACVGDAASGGLRANRSDGPLLGAAGDRGMTSSDLETNSPRGWGVILTLFALSLLAVYSVFHQSRDWNTATRLLLTYALVQNGDIEITPFVTRDGTLLRDPPTRDLSSPGDGRYFCDKAPGHSFLGAPAYWAALKCGLVSPYPTGLAARAYWPADYWTTLGTNGLYTALTGVLLTMLLHHLGMRPSSALLTGQACALASIAFPYATLYYGHSTCAFFTLASVYLLCRWPGKPFALLAGGLAAGIAVTIDYPQAVFAVGATAVVFASGCFSSQSRFSRWSWLWFALGGLPMAGLLGWYHYLVTGSAWQVPYTMEVEEIFAYHKEGWGIPIAVPKPAVVLELLIGRKRGLFWYSPVVFGAVAGLVVLWSRRRRWLAMLVGLTFAGLLAINAGFPTWDGGWAVGPRFLLPAFPLLFVAVGAWIDSQPDGAIGRMINSGFKVVWAASGLLCMALLAGFAAVGGRAPSHIDDPIRDFLSPSLSWPPQGPLGLAAVWNSISRLGSSYFVCAAVCVFALLTQGLLLYWCLRGQRRTPIPATPSLTRQDGTSAAS